MRLVFDIEANGLYEEATKIWCIIAKDIDTGEIYEWTIDSGSSYLIFLETVLSKATQLVGHNILNYDLPLLKKLSGTSWSPNESVKITDTLVMSRLAHPDRPRPPGYTGKGGPHSLEAWGYRLGKSKPEHEDWSVFSPAMLRRCREDVGINNLVYHSVSGELDGFSDESLELEHRIADIITQQEHRGIRFDRGRADRFILDLTARIKKIDDEIIPKLPRELERIGAEVKRPFLKTGGHSKQVLKYIEEAYEGRDYILGPFNRIMFHDFDLGSVQKVKQFLLDSGWMPDSWNFSKKTRERTSPKLEGAFDGVDGDVPRQVKNRITWRHRRSQIEGWLKNGRMDSDIHVLSAGANSCGTPTHRFRHHTVVNVPKANSDKEGSLIWDISKQKDIYGTQMRSLFIPRDGHKMVGHDASGLELRMLAHYLNDKEFTSEILDGDIHSFNQQRAGLPTRDAAKTFIYALIYGAGDKKMGSIVGGDASDGADIKARYFSELPPLEKFISTVKRAAGKGFLKGLDGRKVWMRRDDSGRIARSKAPNTLLQHSGAIVMKRSCVLLWDEVKHRQIEAYKVLDMHDEGQSEVLDNERTIELYCDAAVRSIQDAGKYYNMNIPLDAEAKVGMSWAETH
jgi:DNA polymerase-1